MSIISCTSPWPSSRILPASIETSRPSAGLWRRNSSAKAGPHPSAVSKLTSGSRLSPGRRYYARRSDHILTALIEADRVGVTDEYDDHRHRGGGGVVIPDRVARRVLAGARRYRWRVISPGAGGRRGCAGAR